MPEIYSTDPEELGYGRVWITRSKTRPDVRHTTLLTDDGKWHCTCEGWVHRYNCRHVNELKELVNIDDEDFEVSL